VSIEVRDGGPGLRPEDAEVAFERGVLRERYRDSRPVGTGLGLSIASRLTSRLGGHIRAGTAVAGGAVFTVTLPVVA
jgi:signal transduction histidine kinase